MKVAIYGHSQAQPTGLADDLVYALKKRGHKVLRLGLAGKSDKVLLERVDELGDWQDADRIVLYGHSTGNGSTKQQTVALLTHLGLDRTILVLPPLNLSRGAGQPKADLPETNAQRIADHDKKVAYFGQYVPTFYMVGYDQDFHKDRIHARPGTPPGKGLLATLMVALELEKPPSSPVRPAGSLLLPLALLGAAVWWFRRPRGA